MIVKLVVAACAVTVLVGVSVSAQNLGVELQRIAQQEVTTGNLQQAIDAYKQLIDRAGSDPEIAARALIHLAEAYERRGDEEARRIYERIVRDYASQPAAVATARARLSDSRPTPTTRDLALRKVWTNPNGGDYFLGGLSPDGRYLTYATRYNTALFVRDLAAGTERELTTPTPGTGTASSVVGRDGTQVAYDWCTDKQCELRIASLRGQTPPRTLFVNAEVPWLQVQDWSPDGSRIAVVIGRPDATKQIAWVGAADGSLHVWKSTDWRGPTRMLFSPDGQEVAFDLAATDRSADRDVFVLAVDGTRETPAVVDAGDDHLIGWTPDGRHLLFASDRTGAMGLWALPWNDRRPVGSPRLIKADFGNMYPLRITNTGALFATAALWNSNIEILPIDVASGTPSGPTVRPVKRFTGATTQPAWSPDGKWLAYRSARGAALATGASLGPFATSVIGIQSRETGETREIRPPLAYFRGLTWAPDNESLVAAGLDFKGRSAIFRIDARSGEVIALFTPASLGDQPTYEGLFWSPNGERLYYHSAGAGPQSAGSGNGAVHELDVARRADRILFSGSSATGYLGPISVSPDGRWVVAAIRQAGRNSLLLFPIEGGTPRTLLSVEQPLGILKDVPWMPDGQAIVVSKLTGVAGDSRNEVWIVPVDGTAPRKLGVDASRIVSGGLGRVRLHPDGRHLTYVSGDYFMNEVWALENFLPAVTAGNGGRAK